MKVRRPNRQPPSFGRRGRKGDGASLGGLAGDPARRAGTVTTRKGRRIARAPFQSAGSEAGAEAPAVVSLSEGAHLGGSAGVANTRCLARCLVGLLLAAGEVGVGGSSALSWAQQGLVV
jgi:hypothetical protein